MIRYVNGDLLGSNAEALVNTVNLVGVMGKGVALRVKNAFPHNFEAYRIACANRELSIGKLLVVKDSNLLLGEKLIINFPTKTHWRLPSEYTYVEQGLIALEDYIQKNKLKSIAMPAPGCGNGGLDWPIVKGMVEKYLSALDADISIYGPPA